MDDLNMRRWEPERIFEIAYLKKYYHMPLSDPVTARQVFIEMDGKIYDCQQAGNRHFFMMAKVRISFEYLCV